MTDQSGLTMKEVKERQKVYGRNEITVRRKKCFTNYLRHICSEPIYILLFCSAIIYFILGEQTDGMAMIAFVIFVIGIDIFQDVRTGNALKKLREITTPRIQVIREGIKVLIPKEDLVPGDLMLVYEGVKIPADGYLVFCAGLCIDESILTGESVGVMKCVVEDKIGNLENRTDNIRLDTDEMIENNCPKQQGGRDYLEQNLETGKEVGYFRKDYCYTGTSVILGTGAVVVDKTGNQTEYGKIAAEITVTQKESSLLQKQMKRLAKQCTYFAAVLFIMVSVVTYFNLSYYVLSERIIHSMLAGVVLALSMVPGEFPVILSVFFSMGALRLAKKNALIRRLSAVETLGAISVLCMDKTGTITHNKMKVLETYIEDRQEYKFCEILARSCKRGTYDPLEKAILDYGEVLCKECKCKCDIIVSGDEGNQACVEGNKNDKDINTVSKERNIQRKERNIQRKERNIQRKERNIQGKDRNIQGKERNIQGKERNIQGKERNIQGKERNIQRKDRINREYYDFIPSEEKFVICDLTREDSKLLKEYAFTNEVKAMGQVWRDNNKNIVVAKGSPESIISLCILSVKQKLKLYDKMMEYSKEGLRVIAIADRTLTETEEIPESLTECELYFRGMIALSDPPRENISDKIKECYEAGIRVVMITGDHPITAMSIAMKVGITNCLWVITGDEIAMFSEEELKEKVKLCNIYARVLPLHKMRIVKALKDNGDVVAMTGDGVNDSPAQKIADIGVAMGKYGSEVCREAADLILLDDNLATILDSVKDGRRIYQNILKTIGYVFAFHIPIALICLIAPLLGIGIQSLLLMPLHIVLLELIMDPTVSIALERQPPECDFMMKPPRNPFEGLLTKKILMKSIIQGLAIFVTSFCIYYGMLCQNYSVALARTTGFTVLVLSNILLVLVNCSEFESITTTIKRIKKDRGIWIVNIIILSGLFIMIYTPLHDNMGFAPLSLMNLLITIVLSLIAVLWYEVLKLIKRKSLKQLKKHNETT